MRDIAWVEALCKQCWECLECGLSRTAGVDCLRQEEELLRRGRWASSGCGCTGSSRRAHGCG